MIQYVSRSLLVVFILPFLSSCAAWGLSSIQAATTVAMVGIPAAILTEEAKQQETEIRGQYENGFWFDRDLFSVWVTSNSSDFSEKVAKQVANDSCSKRKKTLDVIWASAWQERRLFIPIKTNRYSYELRFRCTDESG